MGYYASRAVAIAQGELGYLEKASNSQLEDKSANPGAGNFTKYARDLCDAGYYNGSKNGYAWCDVFVDWVIWRVCGRDPVKAQALICQTGPYGASCTSSAQYYKQAGRFYALDPRAGDQIFFWNDGKTAPAHTGLVVEVDAKYVHTIEGNTSSASGVVDNGGGVFRKKYSLSYHRIYGYGRPNYDPEPEEGFEVRMQTLRKGDKGPQVRTLQAILIGLGHDCGQWGADGDFGGKTEEALRKYQSRNNLDPDGVAGPKTWKKLLGQ